MERKKKRKEKDSEFCLRYNRLKCLLHILVEISSRQLVLKAAETVGVNDITWRVFRAVSLKLCCTLESLGMGVGGCL